MEAASAYLPDDVVVEILARLPAKPLCRCRCVSRAWRRLISDPAHRRRFAQTLSGLFYHLHHHPPRFAGLRAPPPPGVDTALSFLPPSCAEMELIDACNGLLLLRSAPRPRFYVVCNPATGEWVALPPPSHAAGLGYGDDDTMADRSTRVAALGFDPATSSSHFHVFQLVEEEYQYFNYVVAVEIYSSETGKWILRESGWSEGVVCNLQMTYLNGYLHLATDVCDAVASLDTKGQTWRLTCVPQRDEPYGSSGGGGIVGHSQGRLLYVDGAEADHDFISIYILHEDHDCWQWTFKHSVSKLDLHLIPPGKSLSGACLYIAAFHPDGDLIYFYDWRQERLVSYDMTHGVVHVICTLKEVSHAHHPFLPYAPLYSGPLVLSSAD